MLIPKSQLHQFLRVQNHLWLELATHRPPFRRVCASVWVAFKARLPVGEVEVEVDASTSTPMWTRGGRGVDATLLDFWVHTLFVKISLYLG